VHNRDWQCVVGREVIKMAAQIDSDEQRRLREEGDRLYEQYVKPLEADHWGEFIMVYPDGRLLLGPSAAELLHEADECFGTGGFMFRIGPRVMDRWR
jgi:hypothetical protein